MLSRLCVFPMNVFESEPFNLVQGDPIVAKVSATNAIGESLFSELSTITGFVQTVP